MNKANINQSMEAVGPKGYPLLGVIPKLRQDPLQFFLSAAIEYGDIVRLDMGLRKFYLVTRPESLKYILLDNHKNFNKGYDQAKPLMGEGLVTSEGDFWLRQRRLIQPMFNYKYLDHFTPFMIQATEEMLERWASTSTDSQTLEISNEMMKLTQNIILRTMFSTDIGERTVDIGADFDAVLQHLNMVLFSPHELFTRLPTPTNLRNQRALRRLDEFIYGLISARRRSGEDKGDLLSRLLTAKLSVDGESMEDKQIRDELMTIFLAGHETTANALSWTWYLLSKTPEVEQRLLAEIDSVLGGRTPSFEDVEKLVYARMVFDEALRLFPPAWMFARHALEDDEVGGYRIPAGAMVMVSPYVTHRLPDVWEQPERFDPDRFAADSSGERHKYAYIPFGGGPRLCLGNNFAIVEAILLMTLILQRFSLQLVPGAVVKPTPIATLQPRPGVPMRVKLR